MASAQYSVPHFLQCELTYGCNSHCVFCYNPSRERHYPVETTRRILQSVREAEVPLVQLTGGEVSMLPELNEYADLLADRSKVSIVTNGIRRCDLSSGITKIFLSLHGNKPTHELITANPGSYDTIVSNISHYVSRGFYVAADVILCATNFDQMYEIIGTAAKLGMQEVYINRFQGGGFGVEQMDKLMPPIEMFRRSLDQIIAGRDDFGIGVAFGTSIPLCIDERLITSDLEFNCEMGVKFAAIAPDGELRLCNQALEGYGNVMQTPLEQIWRHPSLNKYRDLSWVTGVCRECELLDRCGAGCRVDNSQEEAYCPDAFVRNMEKRPALVEEILAREALAAPAQLVEPSRRTGQRTLKAERDLIVIRKHQEKYLARRNYTALVVDETTAELCAAAQTQPVHEPDLYAAVRRKMDEPIADAVLGRYIDHLVASEILIEA